MKRKKGFFMISLDTELAWGESDLGRTEKHRKYYEGARECIDCLLLFFKKYNIRATFALVGHLMLDGGMEEVNIEENSIWYGQDILKKIIAISPQHEIASHSFSHRIFGAKGCTYEGAKTDIQKCVEAAKLHNLELKSFVFPRNSEGYKEVLQEQGFKVYRGKGNEWYEKIRVRVLRKIGHILDEFLVIAPNTSLPVRDELGLYNIPGNMLYLSRDGLRRLIPISSRVKKAKKGIDKAIERGEVFHLWFHPCNLATDQENLLRGIDEVLCYAREKIVQKQMTNIVMSDIPRLFA